MSIFVICSGAVCCDKCGIEIGYFTWDREDDVNMNRITYQEALEIRAEIESLESELGRGGNRQALLAAIGSKSQALKNAGY